MIDVSIRKYKAQDRQAIRDICYDTAFLGESASVFFDAKEILADFVTLYFTDYEPESCFVSEVNPVRKGGALNPTLSTRSFIVSPSQPPQGAGLSNGVNGEVIGYLTGSTSITRLRSIFITRIAPKLGMKVLLNRTIFKKKNIIFLSHWLLDFLKGEFLKAGDFSKQYPATLHINLKRDFRSLGIGTKLVSAYLDYLIKKDISGIHLATISDKAGEFFEKVGFNLLSRGSISCLRYILHRDVPIYIYGKKLR